MPTSANFPEPSLREKMACTGMETSTRFKASDAEKAFLDTMNSQEVIDERPSDPYISVKVADRIDS